MADPNCYNPTEPELEAIRAGSSVYRDCSHTWNEIVLSDAGCVALLTTIDDILTSSGGRVNRGAASILTKLGHRAVNLGWEPPTKPLSEVEHQHPPAA